MLWGGGVVISRVGAVENSFIFFGGERSLTPSFSGSIFSLVGLLAGLLFLKSFSAAIPLWWDTRQKALAGPTRNGLIKNCWPSSLEELRNAMKVGKAQNVVIGGREVKPLPVTTPAIGAVVI